MTDTVKRRPGRPSRAEATRKALEALGVDPQTIDPKAILAAIAADASAPASARVAAARTLLQTQTAELGRQEDDPINARAIEIMMTGRLN